MQNLYELLFVYPTSPCWLENISCSQSYPEKLKRELNRLPSSL